MAENRACIQVYNHSISHFPSPACPMETGLITPSAELKRVPTLAHSLLAIVGTAVLICVGYGVFKVKVEVLLTIATALVGLLARWLGLSWREMQAGMLQSIH